MKVRKFWITNGKAETIEFTNNESKIFLNNPTGLGISNAITSNVYNEKLDVITSSQDFAQIGGEMLFYDYANKDKYESYNEFITFLMSKPLTLYYQIPTDTPQTFNIDVDLLSIDKTEVKTDGLLRCNFAFQPLSRWKGDEITLEDTNSEVEVVNNGHMPVGFEITISRYNDGLGRYDQFENPYIEIYQDDNLYGIAKFVDNLQNTSGHSYQFSSVYINSNDGEQNVVLKRGQANGIVVPNPLGYQDLSVSNGSIYVTFVKLAKGTSTLKFYSENGAESMDYTIKYTPLYRSV